MLINTKKIKKKHFIDCYFLMNYGVYDTICCKYFFYLLIYNELSCINTGNQLHAMTNKTNINTILQSSNFNVVSHGYFLQCSILNNF